jgi:hypothetical protein
VNQKKCLCYSYQGKTYKIYISYDERVFLPVARNSMKFKRLYKGRTAVERLNGRLDRDFMFEDHCFLERQAITCVFQVLRLVAAAMIPSLFWKIAEKLPANEIIRPDFPLPFPAGLWYTWSIRLAERRPPP